MHLAENTKNESSKNCWKWWSKCMRLFYLVLCCSIVYHESFKIFHDVRANSPIKNSDYKVNVKKIFHLVISSDTLCIWDFWFLPAFQRNLKLLPISLDRMLEYLTVIMYDTAWNSQLIELMNSKIRQRDFLKCQFVLIQNLTINTFLV